MALDFMSEMDKCISSFKVNIQTSRTKKKHYYLPLLPVIRTAQKSLAVLFDFDFTSWKQYEYGNLIHVWLFNQRALCKGEWDDIQVCITTQILYIWVESVVFFILWRTESS